MNRDAIIRKINHLLNLAQHPFTEPHLVDASIRKYEKLMEEYNLTMDDITIREEGIYVSGLKSEKGGNVRATRNPMGYVVLPIKQLTNTALIVPRAGLNNWQFVGNKADVQYAEWIYDLIKKSMYKAGMNFKLSRDYHNAINNGVKGQDAIYSFEKGFAGACALNLKKMIEEQSSTGNALIVVKNELITQFLDAHKIKDVGPIKARKDIAIKDNTLEYILKGQQEGNKVTLRKGLT